MNEQNNSTPADDSSNGDVDPPQNEWTWCAALSAAVCAGLGVGLATGDWVVAANVFAVIIEAATRISRGRD